MNSAIENWHLCIEKNIVDSSFMDEGIEFYSPFVYKPIQGTTDVMKYLNAANVVINNEHFKYTDEIIGERSAFLLFETKLGDIFINGVDYIVWNEQEKLTELRVLIRPFTALTLVAETMAKHL
jgi:hypothetical protein|tara:strand:+ start:742 stop:1110 length:369 start_codon:yes stop_codon:yes gene_type:complete